MSTGYDYTRELLGSTRGILVEDYQPDDFADAIESVLSEPCRKRSLEENALTFGAKMLWPEVAREYEALHGVA